MSPTDLHQVVFKWPHTEPTTVIVTGTFDEWASSMHLVKVPAGFEGVTQIPWGQKIKYKFIVDGEWLIHEDQPTEVDPGGFINNIYTAPAKPTTSLPLEAEKTITAEANNHTTNGNSVVAEVVDQLEYTPQPLPKHAQSLTGTDTSAVGNEPRDIPKIAIPTPQSNDPGMGPKLSTVMEKKEQSSPIAPLLPIMIVPVNAAENNTVVSSSPPESMHVLPRIASSPKSVVNTPHIPKSVEEESTQRTTESTLASDLNTLPTSESVIPSTEPISTSVTATVAEVSAPSILVEQSSSNPEPVAAAVIPSTYPNLVTEEKAQTPNLVPESKSHSGNVPVVIEKRKLAQPTSTPTIPSTFRKKASTTSSVKDSQEFGSNSPTTNNSPTSSRFNSIKKKRTSFFGRIKSIFHDKEKEKEKK